MTDEISEQQDEIFAEESEVIEGEGGVEIEEPEQETEEPVDVTSEGSPIEHSKQTVLQEPSTQKPKVSEPKPMDIPTSTSTYTTPQGQIPSIPLANLDENTRQLVMAWYWAGYYQGLQEGRKQ